MNLNLSDPGSMKSRLARLSRVLVRQPFWLVWLGIGLAYTLAFGPDDVGHDAARYLMLAKSLAAGDGYRALNLPGTPPFTLYPPGLPLLLTPMYLLFPQAPGNLGAMQLIPALLGWLSVPLVYGTLRKQTGMSSLLSCMITLAAFLANLAVTFTVRYPVSEAPYAFFSFAAMLLLTRAISVGDRGDSTKSNWILALASLLIACSYLVREVGLALFGATVVYFLLQRSPKRALVVGIVFAAAIAPWAYRNVGVGSGLLGNRDYHEQFLLLDFSQPHLGRIAGPADILRRLGSNLQGHATQTVLQLMFPPLRAGRSVLVLWIERHGLTWAVDALGTSLLLLMVVGFAGSVARRVKLFDLYVLFYAGMILMPPWYEPRNLVPISPLLLYYLVSGVRTVIRPLRLGADRADGISKQVALGVLTLILASNLFVFRHDLASGSAYRRGEVSAREAAFRDAAGWITHNTAPGVSSRAILYQRESPNPYQP